MEARAANDQPAENVEMAKLRKQYEQQRRAVRWGSGLLAVGYLALWALVLVLAMEKYDYSETSAKWLLAFCFVFCCTALLVTLLFILRLQRTRKAFGKVLQSPTPPTDAAAPMGLADQPAERDTLGFGTLAEAIGGLLQHPATQAPYTLVLSGGWGSGKSSLMAQVRRLLTGPGEGPGFQSLWFNVWHFQSEQHLLATFLGSILARCEELPGFQRRLWWRRFLGQGFWEALRTMFVVAMLLPLVGGLLYWLVAQARGWPVTGVPLFSSKPDQTAFVALTAWGGAAWSMLKTWQERSSLLAGIMPMGRFRLEAARADPGFRRKYQQEFRQIMRAAPPGTRFLICIDDVDRIPGSRVLELLESINFISDTASQSEQERGAEARLYFLLGMYVPEVARTLGEALDAKSRRDEDTATRHAARYLAKLVDLVVPLPGLQHCTPEQLHQLLFGGQPPVLTPAPESASITATPLGT